MGDSFYVAALADNDLGREAWLVDCLARHDNSDRATSAETIERPSRASRTFSEW